MSSQMPHELDKPAFSAEPDQAAEEQAQRARVQHALAMFSPDEGSFTLRQTGEWQRNLGTLADDPIAQEVFEAVRQRSDSESELLGS